MVVSRQPILAFALPVNECPGVVGDGVEIRADWVMCSKDCAYASPYWSYVSSFSK